MPRYVATISTPGYLPDEPGEPAVFRTATEAWWYLYHERAGHELDNDCDDDSETMDALSTRARTDMVCDFEKVGSVAGPTPGYRGDHDLGLVYEVAEVPLKDEEVRAALMSHLAGAELCIDSALSVEADTHDNLLAADAFHLELFDPDWDRGQPTATYRVTVTRV